MNKTKKKKLNARNSKVLHETMVTLGTLKEGSDALEEMEINEIQVHLLDEDGDGVILCLEYDEQTGELNRTFSTMNDYYAEGGTDDGDGIMVALEDAVGDYDPCISPENVKEFLKKRIEETISEEYDEIFYNSDDDDDDEPPPLLN